jgi:soluble lytic murein transglycosylase-like protein
MYLVGSLPDGNASLSYQKKYVARAVPQVQACLELAHLAEKMDADVFLVLSVAAKESWFKVGLTSPAGAVSIMGIMPKYCRTEDGGKCKTVQDRRAHGIRYLTKLADEHELCDALAKYNAGNAGSCEGTGSKYAHSVMETYSNLCAVFMYEKCYCC